MASCGFEVALFHSFLISFKNTKNFLFITIRQFAICDMRCCKFYLFIPHFLIYSLTSESAFNFANSVNYYFIQFRKPSLVDLKRYLFINLVYFKYLAIIHANTAVPNGS